MSISEFSADGPPTGELAAIILKEDFAGDLPPGRFLDRELSWLAFNKRVLDLADDPGLPLLDRTKFLAIFARNLDEFFMVRVAGLKRRIATGIAVRAASGLTPREVLENIWERAFALQRQQADYFLNTIEPELNEAGIHVLRWDQLTPVEKTDMDLFFRFQSFPYFDAARGRPFTPFSLYQWTLSQPRRRCAKSNNG